MTTTVTGAAAPPADKREPWRVDAACRDLDPTLFFPVGETGDAIDETAAAIAVCNACPVRAECLDFAIRTRQHEGIWGGTTPAERRSIRRRKAAVKH